MTWYLFDAANSRENTRRGLKLIGKLVKRRRQRLGLTQQQLGSLCAIDQSVISRLETDKLGGLRWSRFADLVAALGGVSDTDPMPGWTKRFMPQEGGWLGVRQAIQSHGAPAGPARRGERDEADH
jgi:transcriptional regulator with XRE-family HTH domain